MAFTQFSLVRFLCYTRKQSPQSFNKYWIDLNKSLKLSCLNIRGISLSWSWATDLSVNLFLSISFTCSLILSPQDSVSSFFLIFFSFGKFIHSQSIHYNFQNVQALVLTFPPSSYLLSLNPISTCLLVCQSTQSYKMKPVFTFQNLLSSCISFLCRVN